MILAVLGAGVLCVGVALFWPDIVGYPQIHLDGKNFEAAVVQANDRLFRDAHADWKVRMSFFGKVIDEQGHHLDGVDVHFQWTDNSFHGTSEADTKSDMHGSFQLTGRRGKRLLVYLRVCLGMKPGLQATTKFWDEQATR